MPNTLMKLSSECIKDVNRKKPKKNYSVVDKHKLKSPTQDSLINKPSKTPAVEPTIPTTNKTSQNKKKTHLLSSSTST
jgi:hypothetical protein